MTNNKCARVGNSLFDVEIDCAAAQVHRAGNVPFVPFMLVADVHDYRFAAF